MSIKLEVGKRYVTRNHSVADVIYTRGTKFIAIHEEAIYTRGTKFIAMNEYGTLRWHDEDGTSIEDGRGLDLIADAPQTVNVWFVVHRPSGKIEAVQLTQPEPESLYPVKKAVGPVRVEVPR